MTSTSPLATARDDHGTGAPPASQHPPLVPPPSSAAFAIPVTPTVAIGAEPPSATVIVA